jgi:sterol desaturase/sphingolipid hydroxylase (fatty acid hydroxylase superfamily)
MNYVVLAIPVFFLLIGLELLIARVQEKEYYTLADSVADLGCGLVSQLVEAALKTVLFAGYLFLYGRFRLFNLPAGSALTWASCLLGVDFLYYWFHRKSHEVNAFWAAHVVHHQSEEYNLSVALRQGAFQSAFSWVFYLPLALLGFPPLVFLAVSSIDTLYQFWIHTRAIGRLGPLERVLNTPSNHRVHHAANPRYLDRNYAGVLMLWDRLFGTYAAERDEDPPRYGIVHDISTFNPVRIAFHEWAALWRDCARARSLREAAGAVFGPPGWRADGSGETSQAIRAAWTASFAGAAAPLDGGARTAVP